MNQTVTMADFLEQGNEIRYLQEQIRENHLPHALLITGEEGTGKKALATLISAALLCKEGEGQPCMRCHGCLQALEHAHADQIVIRKGVALSPEMKDGRATIPVEDIREMIRICGMTPLEGGNRVVLIKGAEDMTVQAQNALLKTLEEPPDRTWFLLVSSRPESLLRTIISRCHQIRLHPISDSAMRKKLREAGISEETADSVIGMADGCIGKALQMAQQEDFTAFVQDVTNVFFRSRKRSEILSRSNEWKNRKGEADLLFTVLESMIHRMMQARFGKEDPGLQRILPENWMRFLREAEPEAFSRLYDAVQLGRREIQFSVNFQTVFEQTLFCFMGEGNQWLQ